MSLGGGSLVFSTNKGFLFPILLVAVDKDLNVRIIVSEPCPWSKDSYFKCINSMVSKSDYDIVSGNVGEGVG